MICIGHRGARASAPENTLAGIEVALIAGAHWIEIDVRAHQGELLVIHDDSLDRTTDGQGYIKQHSLAQLRQLDAGNGQQIPLLAEVFDAVKQRAVINIELKDSTSAALVLDLIEQYVAKGWHYDDFLVSSFFHHDIRWLKQQQPLLRIGALGAGVGLDYAEYAAQLNAYSINLCHESLNQAMIDDAHRRGLKVFVYTVNQLSEFEKLQQMAVDGLFTDYPDKMLKWLAS